MEQPLNQRFPLNDVMKYNESIDVLNLPISTDQVLKKHNVLTLNQLMDYTVSELLDIPMIGDARAFNIVYGIQRYQQRVNK